MIDPDPISIILEIANLVFQPGSLALLANVASGAGAVAAAAIAHQDISNRKRSDVRRALYEIDRALTKGFSGLMTLGSILDEFSYLERPKRVGGAPVTGFKNAEALRRTHEDCRAAVKEARDAFMSLSALLSNDYAEVIDRTINRLNELSYPILNFGPTYGTFLVAGAFALHEVDVLICTIGPTYDFRRAPRDFVEDLRRSLPNLPTL